MWLAKDSDSLNEVAFWSRVGLPMPIFPHLAMDMPSQDTAQFSSPLAGTVLSQSDSTSTTINFAPWAVLGTRPNICTEFLYRFIFLSLPTYLPVHRTKFPTSSGPISHSFSVLKRLNLFTISCRWTSNIYGSSKAGCCTGIASSWSGMALHRTEGYWLWSRTSAWSCHGSLGTVRGREDCICVSWWHTLLKTVLIFHAKNNTLFPCILTRMAVAASALQSGQKVVWIG